MSIASGDVRPRSSRSLLGTIVRSAGEEVGRVVDILSDRRFTRAVGFALDEHGARSSVLPCASAGVTWDAVARDGDHAGRARLGESSFAHRLTAPGA